MHRPKKSGEGKFDQYSSSDSEIEESRSLQDKRIGSAVEEEEESVEAREEEEEDEFSNHLKDRDNDHEESEKKSYHEHHVEEEEEDKELREQLEEKMKHFAPFREYVRNQKEEKETKKPKELKSKGQIPLKAFSQKIPEAYFIGEIVDASGFELHQGLSVFYKFIWDAPWTLLEGSAVGQTQTALLSWSQLESFKLPLNHPLDVHFAAPSTVGWPKILILIRGIDSVGRSNTSGYGFAYLPTQPGHSRLTIHCWRPTGSMRDEIAAFFLGNTAQLTNDDLVCHRAAWTSRCRLITVPAGIVTISLSVMLRHFGCYGIDSAFPPLYPSIHATHSTATAT